MQKFRQHTVQLLVATDVAARGLDVSDRTHVINYGLPDDIENYTHRSGRTGRAGKKGTSISIIHTREKSKVRNIERVIGKDFVDGTLPTAEEICKNQLYKAMDDIMKTDVDEEQIALYMDEINRQFEYIDKEDILKKMVAVTFGRFLEYYKNAPEIERPSTQRRSAEAGSKGRQSDRQRGPRKAEAGYTRLFINLGKADGFYPGEVMQYINRHVKGGRQEVGHIDLLSKFAYIEVPQDDAQRVMRALNGTVYKGREVRCNEADEAGHGRAARGSRAEGRTQRRDERGDRRPNRERRTDRQQHGRDDWRNLINGKAVNLKGEEPDFSEEGWARRRPKKQR